MLLKMEAMMAGITRKVPEGGASQPAKTRAVSGRMEDDLKTLVVQTAKTVVGLDGQSRKLQGTLSVVALLPESHPYVPDLMQVGKDNAAERQALRRASDNEGLRTMVPPHDRLWLALCLVTHKGKNNNPEQTPTQCSGLITPCHIKTAYRQNRRLHH